MDCWGKLTISIDELEGNPDQQCITIKIKHKKWHIPYFDKFMPAEAVEFICSNLYSTPTPLAPIVQHQYLQVMHKQVYMAWVCMTMGEWKHGEDQMVSAGKLLTEFQESGDIDMWELDIPDGVVQLHGESSQSWTN